ncbi:hypothetical protein ACN47A_28710 [Myxococcus fulvus]|uniref:hypothetical protein n=1 Tax=Myxococcus fulvus TaxID=33 RepID=UPI003B9D2448
MFCTNEHCPGRKSAGFVQEQDGADCLQCKKPLSNPRAALRGLESALKNLEGYETQLAAGLARGDDVTAKVAGANGGASRELLDFARGAIQRELEAERAYIEECRVSLQQQVKWHESKRVPLDVALTQLRDTAWAKGLEAVAQAKKGASDPAKLVARREYYAAIRLMLMSRGFIVSPEGVALGAVFPEKEWRRDLLTEADFLSNAKSLSDSLMKRYDLLGDQETSLNRLLSPGELPDYKDIRRAFRETVGCICVSWTRQLQEKVPVYVPVLGISSVFKTEPNPEYFERYCRHLGLPGFERRLELPPFEERNYNKTDEYARGRREVETGLGADGKPLTGKVLGDALKEYDRKAKETHDVTMSVKRVAHELDFNYETMIHRTNLAALGYRARTLLKLRRPARQALMSYVSFAEADSIDVNIRKTSTETFQAAPGVDLSLGHWHSLNCAEPAALMTASSFFCEGADVLVCFPYEGINDVGEFCNRPKETCPWCAAVELGFRSLSRSSSSPASSLSSGEWPTQYTLPLRDESSSALATGAGFDAFDSENEVMRATLKTLAGLESVGLVKNRDLTTEAYSSVVQTKIGRVRSMYYLLGLQDREVVALDRPMFRYVEGLS